MLFICTDSQWREWLKSPLVYFFTEPKEAEFCKSLPFNSLLFIPSSDPERIASKLREFPKVANINVFEKLRAFRLSRRGNDGSNVQDPKHDYHASKSPLP